MTTALSHPELLTRTNKVRAAAADHHLERLQRELTNLLDAYVEHTDQEQAHLLRCRRSPHGWSGAARSGSSIS